MDFLFGLLQNDALSAIVAFALVLIPAVIIHELGHLFAAKAVGITIIEFGLGFPPRMAKLFRWGETEFTLNWLPLGGFVRPLGEDFVRPVSEEQLEKDKQELEELTKSDKTKRNEQTFNEDLEELERRGVDPAKVMSVNEAKPLGRIFFMAAGAIANFISAFIIFVIVAMIGIPEFAGARANVVYVEPDTALAEAGLLEGDIIESVNGETYDTSTDIFAALRDTNEATILVRRGEQGEEVEVTFTPTDAAITIEQYVRVMGMVEGAPAEQSGMMPGDLFVAFNGERINTMDELRDATTANAGSEVDLTLLRNGEEVELSLTPRVDPPPNEGSMGIVIQMAFADTGYGVVFQEGVPQSLIVSQSLPDAIGFSVNQIANFMQIIAQMPGRIISGEASSAEARPVSIVGISQMGGAFLQQSIEESQPMSILNFIALISIALGLTNLLPLPALDGGRILFVLIEIIRGRPIAPEREGLVHLVGLAFLLSITVIFVLNDIINPITEMLP